MRINNRYGIKSKSVIDALTRDDYDLSERPENVFSCTEIIDAPKAQLLKRRHQKELESDVSDNFWILDGSAVHYAVEMSNKNKNRERLSEERIFIEVTGNNGDRKWTAHTLAKGQKVQDASWYKPADAFYVSAKFDNYEADGGIVEDYKRCSVWETIYGVKANREQQLNICAFALRLLGFETNGVRVCMFIKDWNRREYADAVRNKRKYPEIPYYEHECALWNDEFVRGFLVSRLKAFIAAVRASDDDIPGCAAEERWYRGESLAVMKEGNKTAKRVFRVNGNTQADKEDAARLARACLIGLRVGDAKGKYSIVTRPGNDERCNNEKNYCPARKWCHYWKNVYQTHTEEQPDYTDATEGRR